MLFSDYLEQSNLSHLMTKPTKWHVRPAKTQIILGIRPVWSESSLSAWRKLRSLATHWADLSLRWAHRSFCWFSHEAARFTSVLRWRKTPIESSKCQSITVNFMPHMMAYVLFSNGLRCFFFSIFFFLCAVRTVKNSCDVYINDTVGTKDFVSRPWKSNKSLLFVF